MRFLSLHGYASSELVGLRLMLRFCGVLTLALNTAGSIADRQYGTALVDAVGLALLMGWAEVGPWMLRQIHAVRPADGSAHEQTEENGKQEQEADDPRGGDRPRPRERPGRRRPRRAAAGESEALPQAA